MVLALVLTVPVLVLASIGLVLTRGSGSSLSSDTPARILTLVRATAQQAGSVHVVTSVQIGQGGTASYVNDTGRSAGEQVITLAGAKVTSLVVDGKVYLNANQTALSELFQAPAWAVQAYGGHWFSFSAGGTFYTGIVQTLTLTSLLRQVLPTGPLTKVADTTVNGVSVVGLRGAFTGGFQGTLYVSTSGTPLPVSEALTTPTGTTTVSFSRWGEPIHVTAPVGAVPGDSLAAVLGSSNPGS